MTFISFKPVRVSPAFVPAPSASFSSTAFRTHVFASGSLARAKLVPTAPAFAFPPVTAAPLRTLFIQMQNTPNPRSLKFLPGREVLPATDSSSAPVASFDASNKTAAKTQSPLAHAILLLDGVTSVMFGADFVTVTTEESADWMVIKPQVFAAITDAYATGQPIVSADAGAGSSQEQPCLPGDEETVELIKEIIDMRVRPSVMEDGGDIEFIKLDEERIVWLLMKGSCSGCPSSGATLKHGIQNMLMHYVPEIKGVEEWVDTVLEAVSAEELAKLEEKLNNKDGGKNTAQ